MDLARHAIVWLIIAAGSTGSTGSAATGAAPGGVAADVAPAVAAGPRAPTFFGAALEYAGATRVAYGEERYVEVAWPGDGRAVPRALAGAARTGFFRLPDDVLPAEAYRQYERALGQAGYAVRAQCALDDCDRGLRLRRTLDPAFAGRRLVVQSGWPATAVALRNGAEPHVLIAERRVGPRQEWVAVHVYRARVDYDLPAARDKPMAAVLAIVPTDGAGADRVRARTPDSLADALERDGYVAIEGVRFDAAGTHVAADSNGELAAVAAMLRARPAWHVYVVGHAADRPDTEAAVADSARRARAYAESLAGAGVSAARLSAHGVGPFAPAWTATPPGVPDGRRDDRREGDRITIVLRRAP